MGAPVGSVVGLDRDECVLFLLRIDPLDDSLAEQVVPSDLSVADAFDVLPGKDGPSVLDDEEGASETSLVGVDDDLVHLWVIVDVDLVGQESAPSLLTDVGDELEGVSVASLEVSVDVDTGSSGGVDGLQVAVPDHPHEIGVAESLGDIGDECEVLDQTAVLSLRGLGRAQPSPLSGVKVTGLEVGLGPGE